MACFSIVTILPKGYLHIHALHEIRLLIYYSLRDLGHEVTLTTNSFPEGSTPIVVGAHLITDDFQVELPKHSLIFNSEQLGTIASTATPRILNLAKQHAVWDYSARNLDFINQQITPFNACRLRLGYHPQLERIDRSVKRSDGFVFYGSVTPFREQVFSRMILSDKLRISGFYGIYGWQRDGILSRCMAALNIHSSQTRILEWVRIIPYLANSIPCLALLSPRSRWDDDQISYVLPVDEDDPTPQLEQYYASPNLLEAHAAEMQQRFRTSELQTQFTEQALDQLLSSGFAPAIGPVKSPCWKPPSWHKNPDELWFKHTYSWINDPRTINEYYWQEGIYRQLHPSPNFMELFKKPIRLARQGDCLQTKSFNQELAVVLHFHSVYTACNFFANFGCHLASIADFYITSNHEQVTHALQSLARDYHIENLLVVQNENRGRDIPSKYIVFNQIIKQYDLCLFSHGKESDRQWFYDHNKLLCGSTDRINAILDLFASRDDLGLVFPDYLESIVPFIGWGGMRSLVDDLLSPLGYSTENVDILEFPAGGFYWARPEAIGTLQELGLRYEDLPVEPLPVDDTILHAIERLPCISCEHRGFKWEKLARY